MKQLRAVWRLLRLVGHIAQGLWVVALRFPTLSPDQQHARVQVWSQQLLALAGVHLRVVGQPPLTGPVMLVANHISWLDIPVMHAARHCRFVSKSDVKGWPLIGTLATAAGTLYIERSSRRDALRMVRSMQEALERGEVLAVFPEGTTGDGRAMLPFHANLIQAAVAAQSPVQPVACALPTGPQVPPALRPATSATKPWWAPSGARCARRPSRPWCNTARPSCPPAAIDAPGRSTCTPRWTSCGAADR